MQKNYEQALAWVLESEGGYVNHPKDPGGATMCGITQRTYNAYRKSIGKGVLPVRGITQAEIAAIYRRDYANKIRFDDLPSGLDYAVFDFAVNSGVTRAAKFLQAESGVSQDGVIGKNTLAAVNSMDTQRLIVSLCSARMRFLHNLKTWPTFGRGWTARVEGRQSGAQDNDIGVIDRAVMLARNAQDIPAPVVAGFGKGYPPRGLWNKICEQFGVEDGD